MSPGNPVCPRCGNPIEPTWIGPDLDHPGGQQVIITYGLGWCGACDWLAPEFSTEHREVVS